MTKHTLVILQILSAAIGSSTANATSDEACVPHLARRISAEDWRVRYALAIGFSAQCQRVSRKPLETLIRDKDNRVSNQALVVYLRNFARVDIKLVRENFNNLHAGPLAGITVRRPFDVKSVSFQAGWLDRKDPNNSQNGARIQYIGLLGTREDRSILVPFAKATNPYVLTELAKALIRLGDTEAGLAVLENVLQADVGTALHYQTQAISVIDELDHGIAQQKYRKLSLNVNKNPGIQPNWANEHFVQGLDLSENTE